jgi:DNA invertase Pin-like site-specific DNA recombinase
LHLTGTGGSYLRVSGDRQEVERQLASRAAFEKRHRVKVSPHHQYEDDMPRDLSDKRPDFQRMLKAVKAGLLQWIFVDHIDRFGFADEWELVKRIGELREAGCKLYDSNNEDWTAHGLMSFFKAGLAGHSSHAEQVTKSSRCLGGMVTKAKAGEWMGGPPKLGFDVACFGRATGEELWRVVFEGHEFLRHHETKKTRGGKPKRIYRVLRRRVYPDGRTERLDGNVVFRSSKETQVMRIVPTRVKAKLEAAQGVFRRYATEAVTFFALAKWLNGLGIRNSYGNKFQSVDISKMLSDEAYLGYPTFSKRRNGRFHRHTAEGGIVELEPGLRGKNTASDSADVIRSSRPNGERWFEPLVDRATWDAVQKKLRGRGKATRAPKNPGLYLARLVVCASCGEPMVGRRDRGEYYCGTWHKHHLRGTLADSPCLRNGVKQSVLEEYVNRYLEETGKRLDLLTEGPGGSHLTDRLEEQETQAWRGFRDGIVRLTGYLAEHHPEEYAAIIEDFNRRAAEDEEATRNAVPLTVSLAERYGERLTAAHRQAMQGNNPNTTLDSGGFVDACVACYRANFDPSGLAAEIERLEAEHTALMKKWADLPTPRAKEKAKAELTALEARITERERQQQDASEVIVRHHREMLGLQQAITDAKLAMHGEGGEQALRQRAEALRAILCRIECEFVVTGKRSRGGPGQAGSRLVALHFLPITGDSVRLRVNGEQPFYALAQ